MHLMHNNLYRCRHPNLCILLMEYLFIFIHFVLSCLSRWIPSSLAIRWILRCRLVQLLRLMRNLVTLGLLFGFFRRSLCLVLMLAESVGPVGGLALLVMYLRIQLRLATPSGITIFTIDIIYKKCNK